MNFLVEKIETYHRVSEIEGQITEKLDVISRAHMFLFWRCRLVDKLYHVQIQPLCVASYTQCLRL